MNKTLIFEVVDIFNLSTGNTVLLCTPSKFEERVVRDNNISTIQIDNQPIRTIKILGEDIHVRSDPSMPVKYASFQTSENVEFIKNNIGKNKITEPSI